MRNTMMMMLIAVAAVVLFGGCSGAGAPSSDLKGAGLQSVATNQLSAVALVSSWVGVLYQKTTGQVTPPIRTEMPDGSLRLTGTNTDGSVYEWFILDRTVPDGPGHGTMTWPDDTRFSQEWEATVWSADHKRATERVRAIYPNGASLQFTSVTDYGRAHVPQQLQGTATTTGAATMDFTLNRVGDGQDALALALPDGSRLSLTIPLTHNAYAPIWPRFQAPTTGKLTGPAGEVLDLTLTGTTADAWDRWELTASDGTTGAFSLAAGLAGTGQLRQAGQLVGALGWDAGAQGTLDLLGSGGQEATPSAAARDFQISNWVRNAALLGPMPMY